MSWLDNPTLVQILNGEKPANAPAIRVDIEPGSRWRYSGGGYVVMQQLLIDVTESHSPNSRASWFLSPPACGRALTGPLCRSR
jgi:hypothetical protein